MMTITTEVERIKRGADSVRASTINKGVDVPEDARIDTLAGYIDQIRSDEIHGIIKSYQVAAGESVSAGDFVNFLDDIIPGTDTVIASENDSNQQARAVLLPNGNVFIAYRTGVDTTLSAVICSIDGTTITPGTSRVIATGASANIGLSLAVLTNGNVFVAHRTGGSTTLSAVVCMVNGTTITPGTDKEIATGTNASTYVSAVALHSGDVFVSHRTGGTTTLSAVICRVTNGTIVTPGTDTVLVAQSGAGDYASAVRLPNGHVFISHTTGTSTNLSAIVCSINGTTITPGTDKAITAPSSTNVGAVAVALSNGNVLVAHSVPALPYGINAVVCSVDGMTVTPGVDTAIATGSNASSIITSTLLPDGRVFIAHKTGGAATSLSAVVCSVSGRGILAGIDKEIIPGSSSYIYASAAALPDGNVFISHRTGGATTLSAIVCEVSKIITTPAHPMIGVAKTDGADGALIDVCTL